MIIRRRHTANFTTIGNALLNDERLSLDELGLMAWLRSRPNDWEVRRPALMRRFKVGRDGLRRLMRNLLRYGWIAAEVTRLSDGRVHVIYEVRDEPGPELSEDEARSALSLVSSGAGSGEAADDDGEGDESEHPPDGADPPAGYASPPTGQPGAASRLRLSPPGHLKNLLNTDSVNTESTKRARAFSAVKSAWPIAHVLSGVAAESAFLGLKESEKEPCCRGITPYLADCRANNRKICDLTTYIREHRWERFTEQQQAAGKQWETKPGTPQWYRWLQYNERADSNTFRLMQSWGPQGRSWWAPAEWPPGLPTSNHETTGPPALSDEDARVFAESG